MTKEVPTPSVNWTRRSKPRDTCCLKLWVSQMRVLLILALLSTSSYADNASSFLGDICRQGLLKERMAAAEATRFCSCVVEDVAPKLNQSQKRTIDEAKVALDRGQAISPERFASSGVRALVVAGQARCEAAFYPPSAPITITSGSLQLTLRCDDESRKQQAFIYGRGMALLSNADQKAMGALMMKGSGQPLYANVTLQIDSDAPKAEKWEIDLTGEIVAPQNSVSLIGRLRKASSLSVAIDRGPKKFSANFPVSGRIPARWAPCGSVGR